MKVFNLVKGNTSVSIRIGDSDAEMKLTVDGMRDTTSTAMSPREAVSKVNELIRQGYAKKSTGQAPA